MRVLLIAPHAFYIDRGSPMDVDHLARALSEIGVTVDLVVYRDGEDRNHPGLTVWRAKTPRWLSGIGPGFSIRKLLADAWLFFLARRLLRTRHYDVVHAGEEAVFFAMWFKRWRRIPYVYDMDSSIAQQMIEKLGWLRPLAGFFDWCEAKAIRGALAVAPVCNALADLARARGAAHVVTLHDISPFRESDFIATRTLRDQLGLQGSILLYVGNLEAYQGIDLLLEALPPALERGAEVDLVIAGGTPGHIRHYRQKAAALGIAERAHFIGPWPVARLAELLAQADILAAPRLKGINTPMKVFPYLHSGRAVLVTDLPTHTQVLDASVCELGAPNPSGFADSIVRLARDPGRREALGAAGRRFVEANHVYSAHQRRVRSLYDYVARATGRGPRLAARTNDAGQGNP